MRAQAGQSNTSNSLTHWVTTIKGKHMMMSAKCDITMATASTHRTQNRMKQMNENPDERWNNPTNKDNKLKQQLKTKRDQKGQV